ncbi:MAG: hypothetical protein ABW034_17010 [Steroidobacteraceae bacterium]
MHDNRDDYEPIIATRPSREPLREDAQPLWRLVLALGVGLAVVVLLAWWWMGRSSSDSASTSAQSETSAPAARPDIPVEQVPAPPARDSATNADIAQAPAPPEPAAEPAVGAEQAATPENLPDAVPDNAVQAPVSPAPVSVRFMSPDPQVQIELHGPLDSSPSLTSKAGDVLAVAPGTYRVLASGPQLETFEQRVTFDSERSLEYTVELCAERKHERESLAGQVVEEHACASTAECESLFMVLNEHADQLIKDGAFRTKQCAKWRRKAAAEGRWTLDTQCGGATLATTCRIEIAEGACTFAAPRRSARGTACPRAEFK